MGYRFYPPAIIEYVGRRGGSGYRTKASGHAQAEDADLFSGDPAWAVVDEPDIVEIIFARLLQYLEGTGAGYLEEERLPAQIFSHCIVIALLKAIGYVGRHKVGDELLLSRPENYLYPGVRPLAGPVFGPRYPCGASVEVSIVKFAQKCGPKRLFFLLRERPCF
jgi:hypothetical protein